MDVRLSPEQVALRDAVASAVDRLAPKAVGQLDDRERAAKLEAAVAAAGWRELRVPEEDGAPLASAVEVAVVAEELGRSLADVAFLGPTLATELRRLVGAPPADGVETVAMTADLQGPAEVDGLATPGVVAVDACGAGAALVLLADGGGHRLGRVAIAAGDGPSGADLTRPAAAIDSSVPVGALAAPAGVLDAEDLARWRALGVATTCADLVGTMRGAIDLAVDYAGGRRQFGQPIGSFQAVQHLLADAFVVMEGSRSAARHAAWAVDGLPAEDALTAACVAKAYCARSARTVCETAIQVHGGIGNTWECLAHVFLRRALVSGELFGGVGPSLDRVLAHHGVGGGDGLP